MWILFVVSTVVGLEEPKTTYINTFDSEINCLIDAAVLETQFTEGEKAFCESRAEKNQNN